MPDTNLSSLAVSGDVTVGGNQTVTGNQTITGQVKVTGQTLAAAGASQGTAGQITKSRITVTVTASTEGVKLPVAATNLEVMVSVPGTVGVKVYPNTNGKLDASSTNVAVLLVAGKVNLYRALNTTQWVTFKGA